MAQTSRPTTKNIELFHKAKWWRRLGFGLTEDKIDYATSNNFAERSVSADGQSNIEVWRVDADDAVQINRSLAMPLRGTANFPLATNASIVSQCFFIAPAAMELTSIACVFATADGAANTGYITHETGAQAPGTGNTVMIGTFNLNATANTTQNAVLPKSFPTAGTQANYADKLVLAAGDRLSFKIASAVTSLAGLMISVGFAPGGKYPVAVYNMQANGDLVDQAFYIAQKDMIISRIDYVHATLGTNAGAVTLDIKKCTGTQAAASGTTMLASTFNCKSAINTIQNGTLTATTANLRMAPGDRLAADFTGTLTALAGVVVVVTFQAIPQRKDVSFILSKNANQAVDQAFFVSDGNYEILSVSEVHAVAAGGASKLQVTRDKQTDAPGAGTDLLSNNTSAGFDLAATAETVQVGTFVDTRFNFLMAGDRVSVDYANAAQSTAGVVVTLSLAPR